MSVCDSEERRNRILFAVISDYIATACPVGSQAICEKYHLGVSSATVRNIMVELEEAGLITHPHTSAGRVPTDRGYRHYVNALRQMILDPDETQRIDHLLARVPGDVSLVLDCAARLMAELTHQAAIALYPVLRRNVFKRLEIIPMDNRRLLCVLVTMEGVVRSIVIETQDAVTAEELRALLRFVNSELTGMALEEIEGFLQRRILAQNDAFFYLLKRTLEILRLTLEREQQEQARFEGASFMLAQPEFEDAQKTRMLLQLLETKRELVAMLLEDLQREGLVVRIGVETQRADMADCSIVTMPYRVQGRIVGGLGVLGPRRMEYPRVMATVDYVARRVSDLLTQMAS